MPTRLEQTVIKSLHQASLRHVNNPKGSRREFLLLLALLGLGSVGIAIAPELFRRRCPDTTSSPPEARLQPVDSQTYFVLADSRISQITPSQNWPHRFSNLDLKPDQVDRLRNLIFTFLFMPQAAMNRSQQLAVVTQPVILSHYQEFGQDNPLVRNWTIGITTLPEDFCLLELKDQASYLPILNTSVSASIYSSYHSSAITDTMDQAVAISSQWNQHYQPLVDKGDIPLLVDITLASPGDLHPSSFPTPMFNP